MVEDVDMSEGVGIVELMKRQSRGGRHGVQNRGAFVASERRDDPGLALVVCVLVV